MPTSPLFRLKPLSLALLLALAGCSDADRRDPVVETQAPELEQAASSAQPAFVQRLVTPAAFAGSCEELTAALGALPDTAITATTTVAAGTLNVGGTAIAEHCLVSGKMLERVSSVDGQSYAISFELRMPKQWNGRFFHQGNGGIDGAVVPATGSTGAGALTNALHQGFVVLSSDAGHVGMRGPLFGLDPQARLDMAIRPLAS